MNIIPMTPTTHAPGSKADFAVRYAALGWHVIPLWWIDNGKCACGKEDCKSPGKHPHKLAPRGQWSASNDVEQVARWWKMCPEANIGIYLAPSGLCAIDIDPRNGGIDTIDQIESEHGQIVSDLLQFSGGGGEHRVFERPSGTTLPGKLGPGVDVKLDGYILVEPSNHMSGGTYEWEASSSPLDGCVATPLPDWIRDLGHAKWTASEVDPGDRCQIPEKMLNELWDALQWIKNPDRDTWYRVGMSIHYNIGGQTGFDMWDRWSSTNGSSKYDPADQIRVWRSFKRRGGDVLTMASIFAMAMESGYANIPSPSETPQSIKEFILKRIEEAKRSEEVKPNMGTWIIPVKSLQAIADWFSTLTEEPHPTISVVGALALGSVVTGRKYRSENANWTAMQLVLSAPSGVGKNYIKSGINRLLHGANMSALFGSNFYTHSAAVYWSLNQAPTHICVTDEFGDSFAEARQSENGNKMTVFRALKQVYSDCDDTFRADAYSMSGLSKRDRDEKKTPPVVNPSLTLLGLTTPGQFYSEIKAHHIEGGAMNRFVIFNLDKDGISGRQRITGGIPPEELINHLKHVRHADTDPTNEAFDMYPVTRLVRFDEDAVEIFDRFRDEATAAGDAVEKYGMGNMPRRWRENAMRMATMLAAWEDPDDPIVTGILASWSCRLVRHCGEETIQQLGGKVSDSDYQNNLNKVLETITKAGIGNWVPRSELLRRHRGIRAREMNEILTHLVDSFLVLSEQKEPSRDSSQEKNIGGRPAIAYTITPGHA